MGSAIHCPPPPKRHSAATESDWPSKVPTATTPSLKMALPAGTPSGISVIQGVGITFAGTVEVVAADVAGGRPEVIEGPEVVRGATAAVEVDGAGELQLTKTAPERKNATRTNNARCDAG